MSAACSTQIEALKQFTADSVRNVPVTAIRIDLYAGRYCKTVTTVTRC